MERFFAGVCASVLLKVIIPRDTSPAVLALIAFFACMKLSMSSEITLGGKPRVADFATEWFLSRVSALVILELSFLAESCVTFLAVVGLLAGMRPFMNVEVAFQREAFPALFARVGLFSAVRP